MLILVHEMEYRLQTLTGFAGLGMVGTIHLLADGQGPLIEGCGSWKGAQCFMQTSETMQRPGQIWVVGCQGVFLNHECACKEWLGLLILVLVPVQLCQIRQGLGRVRMVCSQL